MFKVELEDFIEAVDIAVDIKLHKDSNKFPDNQCASFYYKLDLLEDQLLTLLKKMGIINE